ncbi:SNF2 family helicase/ATPase [Histoplasma capsulatum G186AR]|uniref:SNF2 family helicase/ATPase n=1 Tax=Ajellomyces capsulatus TaxID=5037 RepID=A0A8H7YPH0_AJECA|nr:SNF2 family helicase/ATPase [Histoplasma capsulatum]QSS74836.1 SNF2 family helicase/ATPase [Histoplasma capsulatum G186AR]
MDGFEDDDPFEWSIDQVIAHLCHSSAPWARSSLPRPDSTTLETSLRENDVTGEILLTEINKVTLAQDLGLKSLGQRATIFRAVEELQKRSRKYAEYIQSRQVNPSYPIETTRQTAPSSSRPPETPFHAIASAGAGPAAHSRTTAVSQSPSRVSEAQRQETAYLAATGSASVNCRSNEAYVIDRTGKKRRKLFLRQRQSHRTETWEENSRINRSSAYLGPTKVTLPDLFYNNMEDSDDEAFVLEGAKCPIGQKRFVNKRVQHYFLEEHFSIQTKEGKNAVAIFPYSSKILPPGELQFFTLFTQDQGIVKVTKEDIIDWPQFKERDEFDYLLDKYPTEADQGLPPYGDSGSENEYDSDTWQEIKIEEREVEIEKQKSKILSGPEVDGIIDRYIELTSRKWCDQKLPIQQRKAQRLWLSSRKWDTKYSEIKSAQSTIAHLERRLKALRKAIKDTSWSKVNEVQQQCQSMEETVFNREAQKWKISVLELDTCPPKPPSAATPAKPPKPSIPEDEEWLSSEGNDEDIDDINDFIVPDNDVPVSDRSGDKREPSRPAPTLPREAQASEDVTTPRFLREQRVQNSSSSEPKSVRQRSAEHVPLKNSTSPAQLREMKQYLQGPIEVVDLTKSSDETSDHNFDIQTPPLNPVNDTALPPPSPRSKLLHDFTRVKKKRQGTSELQVLDPVYIAETARIGWSVLEERLDRDRLLSKLIWSMLQQERRDLHQLTNSIELEKAKKRVRKALRSVLHHSYQIQNSRKHTLFLRIAALYTSWLRCKKISAMQGIPKAFIEGTLRDKNSYDVFHPKLCEALKAFLDVKDPVTKAAAGKPPEISTNKSDEPERSTSSQISGAEQTQDQDLQELSSGSEIEAHRTPHKKRKRAVKESQEAMDSQRNAQRRVELQEEQRELLARRLRGTGISNTDPERQVVSFDDPVIYLHRHIGARVKPHQLSGIQFMWRELIKDEKRQGCLLAHTMGLGKTMQVISLLVTIANAAASDDRRVRNQIPEALRRSRTLVLCPSSLIENWWEELLMWTPSDSQTSRNIGPFRKILPTLQLEERLDGIASWYMDGGILLMSYDIFRALILNKATKIRPSALDRKTHETVRKHLLEGPSIIVADEAHKLKNRNAGVAEACREFTSKSRIALTGSPLANNLSEYYAMIDWIAPGYLGDFIQFKAKYIEPIQEGLYADSSQWERRQSLKKLQVLKKDIDPKLNRADISVLKGSLPPKVEFVITVPLTPLQEQAYNTYVAALAANNDNVGNPKLWDWLSILSLLCNHPGCFMEKLRDRSKGFQKPPSSRVSPDSDSEIPEDPSIPQVLLSSEVLARIEKDFPTGMDMWSLELSHRAQVADQIIERSIAAGDKVLLFSHSIPTLNYLELVLKQAKRSYSRLDGKTPIATRQIATKNFNSGFDSQVYLISTRAGGLGLNIPGANRVIIFDFQFNPTWEEQAVGRAYRLGQLKPVYVYRFLAGGTYEDVMHNRAVFKTQLAFRVVDKKNPIRWASKNISDYLFSPKFVPQKDLSEFKGKDPAVLDRILAGQKNIRKIALTETFQREDNDQLTPEEEKAVQEELDDERLKRNDPVAWAKKQQVQEPQVTPRRSIFPHSHPLSIMRSAQHPSSYRASDLVPLSANSIPPMTSLAVGPPALTPDTSLFRPANQPRFTNETRVLSSFFSDINGNAALTPLAPSQASPNGPLLPNGDANQPSIPPPPPPPATAAIASSSNIPSSSKVVISQKRPNNVDKDDGHVTGTSNGSKRLAIGQENQVETNAISAVGKESETPQSKTGTSGCRQQ